MSKKIRLIGRNVIGIDEVNNGWHINHDYGIDFPMIICGYLVRNYERSTCSNGKYESKRNARVFKPNGRSLDEILYRSREYIGANPDFFYTTLQKKEYETNPKIRRAESLAAITFEFFANYPLKQNETVVVIDMINGTYYADEIFSIYREYMKIADIGEVASRMQQHADKHNPAVKKADRVAYYIGGLRFRGDIARWPFQRKRTNIRRLPELILRVRNPELFKPDDYSFTSSFDMS